MPSIPQSLLWISLVVLWLFVLVPMLISKRDTVRRTSDVALATRVLDSGARSRLLRRTGPAAGHLHDPNWEPSQDDLSEPDDDMPRKAGTRSVVIAAKAEQSGQAELDYLDVEVVDEDSGALPVGAGMAAVHDGQPTLFDETPEAEAPPLPEVTADAPNAPDGTLAADEYEYVEDTSGLEAEEEPPALAKPSVSRLRRLESDASLAVTARKYRFRKRVLMTMAAILIATAVSSFTVSPDIWWACGSVAGVTVLYLAYLRRQTRIEEQVRRRRQQRMARSRLGVENTEDRQFDVVPSRLRRPGAAVLDIDDEDPIFEHLDEVTFARHYDLPRAAGQ